VIPSSYTHIYPHQVYLTTHTSAMSPRHHVVVPDSDTEVVEVVTQRRMTKRGMRTTVKHVPIEQPLPENTGRASRSRSRQQKTSEVRASKSKVRAVQPDVGPVGEASMEPAHIDDMNTHVFIDGPEEDLPDFAPEEVQPQTLVQSHLFCC
jgi:hypothetical protein